MTNDDSMDDRRFDELLLRIGPDVPRVDLDDETRARLEETIARGAEASGPSRPRRWMWSTATGGAIAAALGIACVLLWSGLGRVKNELATSRWETDEVLQLLLRARHGQTPVPVPEDLTGLRAADLALVTFDHALCPLARVSTPAFQDLERRSDSVAAAFITFDVTGANREAVDRRIDELDMRYALLGPVGAETGVVKVLDTSRRRVLSSAPGARGLEQAELVLQRVQSMTPAETREGR